MTIQELSDEMRKQKARCDRYCGTMKKIVKNNIQINIDINV